MEALPGIPTIRPFEALVRGIPLISSPWDDAEQLFTAGKDFLGVRYGFSPATLVFEATGACIFTDYWEGIDFFFEPDKEIFVAKEGAEGAVILADLTEEKTKAIGETAYRKVLSEHTYSHTAEQLEQLLYTKSNFKIKHSHEHRYTRTFHYIQLEKWACHHLSWFGTGTEYQEPSGTVPGARCSLVRQSPGFT